MTRQLPNKSGKWFSVSGREYRLDHGRVGLIAGWGRYPVVIAEALRAQGARVICAGVEDHADPALASICHEFTWCGLGRISKAVRFMRRHGVRQATMAGKIHKIRLFEPGRWLKYLPDPTTFAMLVRLMGQTWKDDTMLLAVCDTFARGGVTFQPATDFAPELLVKAGQLTRKGPTPLERKDIEFGWRLAKEMGRLDVGQSVAIKDRAVLAVEAIEGTDACIRRAGGLCRGGRFTVVKVAKPQQDMRFDVPTIGVGTLETMTAAGACVLAVEADRTILLDQQDVIDYANRHGLVIVAVQPDEQDSPLLAREA